MPPRRRNTGSRGTLGMLSDPFESLESRIKRLRGDSSDPAEAAVPKTGPPSSSAAPAPVSLVSNLPPAIRTDVPNVRNLRRGSASAASSGLQLQGIQHLVSELIEDRHANTSKGPLASYRATWTKFHRTALGLDAPLFPITVYGMIVVASFSKKGKYRSYESDVTSMRGLHIEAKHA